MQTLTDNTQYSIFQARVRFHNTGPSLVPGVIVMSIEDGHEGVPGLSQLDPMSVPVYQTLNFFYDANDRLNSSFVNICAAQLLIHCGYRQCVSN